MSKIPISNEEFNINKEKYKSTLRSFTRQFSQLLPPDILDYCADMALWKCLMNHRPEYKTKFSTSLYRFVVWQCLQEHRTLKTTRYDEEQGVAVVVYNNDTSMILNEYLSLLSNKYRRVVESRYLYGKTFDEIAKDEGCSKQGAHYILGQAMEQMKRFVRQSVTAT